VSAAAPTDHSSRPGALALPVARFLEYLRVERRLSPRTLSAYGDDLGRLASHLQQAGVAAWDRVDSEHVRAWAAAEHRAGRAGKSVARRLSACRSLFRWLIREGLARQNPAVGVRAPKSARKLPNVLDADEMGAFLSLPDGAPLAVRDRAMLELFYSSALRLSELCALAWDALDLEQGLVRVTGKGGRTRVVPVGGPARTALEAWRSELQPEPGGPVFPGRDGGPISPRAVQLRLKRWAERQGIWKRMHPHLMRHSCASHVLESSGNLRAVQELLGHADISTTQVYTHLDFQHLAKVYDAAHPRARRKSAHGGE
jgi:integrase/recombinase XerC